MTEDTTLGAVAKAEVGRTWKAAQLLDMNKDVLKPPAALPAETELYLPQPQWPTLIPFGLLVLFLFLVGCGYLMRGPPDEGHPVGQIKGRDQVKSSGARVDIGGLITLEALSRHTLIRRDYPVLQGGALLLGIVVMSVNLLVDLAYGLINPRIRHTR